jgi:hypothetical protein
VVNIHLGVSPLLFGIALFSESIPKLFAVMYGPATDILRTLVSVYFMKETRKTKNIEDKKAQINITQINLNTVGKVVPVDN